MDCSLPGSSVPGILQAGVLEWIAISFSRRSSQPRDWTWVSRIAGRHFTIWATREIHQGSHQAQSEGGCFSKDCCPRKTLQDSCDVDRVEEEGAFWILGTADGILGEVQPEEFRMVESPEPRGRDWESQFLGMLITRLGSLRRRKGSGALKEEIGVWNSQGGRKDKRLYFPLHSLVT